MVEVSLLLDAQARLAEGPCWDARRACLFWVDIEGHALHQLTLDPLTDRAMPLGEAVGAVAPCADGRLLLATASGLWLYDLATGGREQIADPESATTGNRFNDGKCSPEGRFFGGTMNPGPTRNAALYRLDGDGSLARLRTGVGISNGLAFSMDSRTFYWADTPTGQVLAFDHDPATGAIANPRVAVQVPSGQGAPDGLTIDCDGRLWVAQWGGWRVVCYDPATGEALATLRVPAARVSACTFGGADMGTLFITTAQPDTPEERAAQPHAGGIFTARPGARGLPAFPYKRL